MQPEPTPKRELPRYNQPGYQTYFQKNMQEAFLDLSRGASDFFYKQLLQSTNQTVARRVAFVQLKAELDAVKMRHDSVCDIRAMFSGVVANQVAITMLNTAAFGSLHQEDALTHNEISMQPWQPSYIGVLDLYVN